MVLLIMNFTMELKQVEQHLVQHVRKKTIEFIKNVNNHLNGNVIILGGCPNILMVTILIMTNIGLI